MNEIKLTSSQNGAALIVGLVLLVVVTVLAVSGMNTATTELAMARNNQNYENAFQAAETGLEQAISRGIFSTTGTVTLAQDVNSNDKVSSTINFTDATLVPDRAFSLGVGSGISAYHFIATSRSESKRAGVSGATTDRDASAIHTQAFYVVGPEQPSL
ncbi:MAG: PilX N-terminal domain-containing pilus assembly protein [Woeseiaceae bacterium]